MMMVDKKFFFHPSFLKSRLSNHSENEHEKVYKLCCLLMVFSLSLHSTLIKFYFFSQHGNSKEKLVKQQQQQLEYF